MGKTIEELFKDKSSFKFGTDYSAVKEDKDTLIETELNGLRIKSAVEIGNPLIYGKDTIRITTRTTDMLDTMKNDRGREGLAGIASGAIAKAKQKVNNLSAKLLGFPSPLNASNVIAIGKTSGPFVPGVGFLPAPPFVYEDSSSAINISGRVASAFTGIPYGPGNEQDTMYNIAKIKDKYGGTEIGKLLKASLGGNPSTVGRELAGNAIQLAKDKLRDAIFGGGDLKAPQVAKRDMDAYGSGQKRYSYVKGKTQDGTQRTDGPIPADDFLDQNPLLKAVSPIYGVERKGPPIKTPISPDDGHFGRTQYGLKTYSNKPAAKYSPKKDENYTAKAKEDEKKTIYGWYGIDSKNDFLNDTRTDDKYKLDKNKAFPSKDGNETEALHNDFIPVWIKRRGSEYPVFFRATITGLNETVSPTWTSSNFAGNPYNFYTFNTIERSTSFNLKVFCMNKDELISMWDKIQSLTKLAYPSIGAEYANSPLIEFRIGDIYNNKTGFIESLTYTIPDDSTWETDGEQGYLPKVVDIALGIKFVENIGAEDKPYGITIKRREEKTTAVPARGSIA